MSRYIHQYVKTCDLCLRTKAQQQPLVGELEPLPIPGQCWDTISMDFIVELPEAHGYDAIMNVVDSVSKRAHFIPTTTTIMALGAAQLYMTHVWELHGLPRLVVSDWGPQFMNQACGNYSLPPARRRPDGKGQSGAGAIPLTLCQ